eukprot:CAMPEP_0174270828 /NCGR_PEP_ID=MMETSP0439-20130205/45864_1 /TAXON_ID=0 /ORGANISM="Stereomyxa ramosa, Strain Chinc5" /LENGTH=362 /DNA_ID=CAMNT_0015360409 /DNA_START=9 /DNA_END=1097 /DNA_ORIENTATION=+
MEDEDSSSTSSDMWDDDDGYYQFSVGKKIGKRYRICGSYGKGVFANVVRVKALNHDTLGTSSEHDSSSDAQEFAVKVIRSNQFMYSVGVGEMKLLKEITENDTENKKYCIHLLDAFYYRNHLCMVLESMHTDIRTLMEQNGEGVGLPLETVKLYGKQLLTALSYLMSLDIIHSDVKPDNLLINDSLTLIKLSDFGSAFKNGDNNPVTPFLVSRYYRAPEIILGAGYGHGIDMWSAGCVIYEMFTGEIMFPGITNNDMLRKHMEVKGEISTELLKQSAFNNRHFDNDLQFICVTSNEYNEEVTKRVEMSTLHSQSIKACLLAAGCESDLPILEELASLLEQCLELDPLKRLTPDSALNHPFFS